MAEGGQPQQQPSQLGPGAAARGMKRESELELPVPGAGADGPEPGLSKRPRTEEAADGGMQNDFYTLMALLTPFSRGSRQHIAGELKGRLRTCGLSMGH